MHLGGGSGQKQCILCNFTDDDCELTDKNVFSTSTSSLSTDATIFFLLLARNEAFYEILFFKCHPTTNPTSEKGV